MSNPVLSAETVVEKLQQLLELGKEEAIKQDLREEEAGKIPMIIPAFHIWYFGARRLAKYSGVKEIIINEERGEFTICFSKEEEPHSLHEVQSMRLPRAFSK